MKLYILLIVNKIHRQKKIKAMKLTKLALFPKRILSYVWERDDRGGGGGGVPPQHRWSAQRWANAINLWPNAVLAFNHPLGQHTVCYSLIRIKYSYIYILKCF